MERFAAIVAEHQRRAKEFVEVKPATAQAFLAAEADRGVSPKTWNDTLKLLRATFKHLHPHLADGSNPFHGLVTKATETVNREPYPNSSAFIQDAIRSARDAAITADVALLERQAGPPDEPAGKELAELYADVRQHRKSK